MLNKNQLFNNAIDIDKFFKTYNSTGFVDWFNNNISKESIWNGIKISNQSNWQKTWSSIELLFGKSSVNIIEFLSINSLIINETGGKFEPITENIGSSGHPGISYAFDTITGTKKSYNTLDTNKRALTLFNDPVYKKAHGTKPLSFLKDTTDSRWSGSVFPLGFSGNVDNETSKNGKTNTFLTEADYMKFRGRGFIQTTGRENYKKIIQFVIDYTGDNNIILEVKKNWEIFKGNLDSIASASTNQQWDDLFLKTHSIIANFACYAHSISPSRYIKYNIINPLQSDVNLHNSIRNVGKAVSGSDGYSNKFLQRVVIQIDLLDKKTPDTIQPNIISKPIEKQEVGREERTGQELVKDNKSDKGINGSLSSVANIFKPTAKPTPIVFKMG